jgi:hypothetical protein
MKLDLGMHIGLHLVFFGKTGVTSQNPARKVFPLGLSLGSIFMNTTL